MPDTLQDSKWYQIMSSLILLPPHYGIPTFVCFLVATPKLIPTVTKVSSDLALFAKRSSSILITSCKITPRSVIDHAFLIQNHIFCLAMHCQSLNVKMLSFWTKRTHEVLGNCRWMKIFDFKVWKLWCTSYWYDRIMGFVLQVTCNFCRSSRGKMLMFWLK